MKPLLGTRPRPLARPARSRQAARGWIAHSTQGPALAGQSYLVPRYPGALDVKPDLIDNVTLLSSIYLNFLQLVVESVEAELGPLDEDNDGKIFGSPNLAGFLNKISEPATLRPGRFIGLHRIRFTLDGAAYGVDPNPSSFTSGVSLVLVQPLVFGLMNMEHPGVFNGGRHTLQDFLRGPAVVRGYAAVFPIIPPVLAWAIRGTKLDQHGGSPSNATSGEKFVFTGIIVFLPISRNF